jgi:hypothetical protein
MAGTAVKRGKYPGHCLREQDERDEALEAYLLAHVPGLKEHYEAQHRAFLHIGEDALARHPDPTPDVIAAEAALSSRKRAEAQVRRGFVPLADHFPKEVRRTRKRLIQRAQRAWNKDNPTPLTPELLRVHATEFMKTYAKPDRS